MLAHLELWWILRVLSAHYRCGGSLGVRWLIKCFVPLTRVWCFMRGVWLTRVHKCCDLLTRGVVAHYGFGGSLGEVLAQ